MVNEARSAAQLASIRAEVGFQERLTMGDVMDPLRNAGSIRVARQPSARDSKALAHSQANPIDFSHVTARRLAEPIDMRKG